MNSIGGEKPSRITPFSDADTADGYQLVAVDDRANSAGKLVLLNERLKHWRKIARRIGAAQPWDENECDARWEK